MSYTRVTKANPCPVCQKPDWCRVFADGWVECMRIQSDKSAKSGGWMHGIGDAPRRYIPPPPRFQPLGIPKINATALMRDWALATAPGALAEFARGLGLSARSLSAVDAVWAAPHAAWAFPMCDGHGNIVGIRLRNERGKFAVRGSRQGIFLPQVASAILADVEPGILPGGEGVHTGMGRPNEDAVQPSEPCSGRQDAALYGRQDACRHHAGTPPAHGAQGTARPTLFVCEGPTDTAAAIELGLFAVGRPNCCCGGAEIKVFARRQAVARVVVVSDNDKPGLDGARKVGGELKLPFAIYVPPAKDVREFVRLGGTRAMIENTLKGTVWHTP